MTILVKKFRYAALCFSISLSLTAAENNSIKVKHTATQQQSNKPLAIIASHQGSWQTWLNQQLSKHPEVIAAKESLNAALSSAKGLKKALYNPEVSSDLAREGEFNNFSIGLSQTIDLWDKRDERSKQANANIIAAQQAFNYVMQEKTTQALQAIVHYQNAQAQANIAIKQEQQLEILLKLVKKRQQTGDLGQVDAELTFLSLSQLLQNTAQAQAELAQTKAQILALLPDWTPENTLFLENGLPIEQYQIDQASTQQWLTQHPLVQIAKAQWLQAKSEANQAQLNTKSDPTIGINAGKTDGDNAIGVSFSMPLNIRNDFSNEARAANQQAIAAEANWQAVMRKQQFAIQATSNTVQIYKKHYQRWQKLMHGRDKRSEALLQQQWQSGDISTTDYLLALQQRAEGLLTGISLKTQFQLSQIEWLFALGQLNLLLKGNPHS